MHAPTVSVRHVALLGIDAIPFEGNITIAPTSNRANKEDYGL